MGAHHDFDASRAERRRSAPTIKLFGETITLPASRPIAAVLVQHRLAQDPEHTMDIEDWVDLLGPMFGPERVRRWIEVDGIEDDDLADLMHTLPTLYRKDPDPEGEAMAPTPAGPSSTTASPGGLSSELTTSVSTAGI